MRDLYGEIEIINKVVKKLIRTLSTMGLLQKVKYDEKLLDRCLNDKDILFTAVETPKGVLCIGEDPTNGEAKIWVAPIPVEDLDMYLPDWVVKKWKSMKK